MKSEHSYLRLRQAARPAARISHLEPLECRVALTASAEVTSTLADVVQPLQLTDSETMADDGVTITATEIRTHDDIIPRFAANPTITAIRSGNWNDPGMWSLKRVPQPGDRISIDAGRTVFFNTQSDVRLDSLEISGSLLFSNTVNTRMIVANLTVMPKGLLQIGTESAPVNPGVTAELVIAEKPLDLASDPRQFGTGLIALGTVRIHGAALSQTWQQLVIEPTKGTRVLYLLNSAANWKAGDTVVLPDTRQIPATQAAQFTAGRFSNQWEEAVIERVSGNLVVLKDPLKYDHRGARNVDGELELLPHVALLNRNVIIRSENPNGTRGHTLYTGRANVDIRYAQFLDLGRTDALRPLDSTKFDSNGLVTHYGTNQIGRYAVHLHHLMGPANATNTGYQFQFVGNSVEGSKKWGVALHGASFGLIERNVVYDAQGAGIVTEDGSEIGNRFINNITVRIQGTHVDGKDGTEEGDYGRGGVGFWFRRGGNMISGNVAADSTYAGFVFDGYYLKDVRLPLFRGADVHDPMQSTDGTLTPKTLFYNNQVYGLTPYGLWAAHINGDSTVPNQPTTYVHSFRIWNVSTIGVWAYHTANVVFDRLLILGSLQARDRNDWGAIGMDFRLYENLNLVIKNSRIEGMYWGIMAPIVDASEPGIERPTILQDSTLKNYINITVTPPRDNVGYASSLEVRNVRFALVTSLPAGPVPLSRILPAANIHMSLTGEEIIYTRPSVVRVYDYNGVSGDNFQVFYREQVGSYVLPKTDPEYLYTRTWGEIGSPEAGLTNAQNWAKYAIALAGAVAPSSAAASRPEINGLVAAIQPPPSVPQVVFVTPWDLSLVNSSFLRIRYNVNGVLPAGAKAYLQLDGGPLLFDYKDGGIFNLTRGTHTISAFIGDANGNRLAGTAVASKRFVVWY